MASEQIIIEYIAHVEGMKAQLRTVQTELKNVQTQSDATTKSTNDGFKKTETSAISLKTQLRNLKAELASATDPKDVQRLAKAAGEVQNKLNDATKAAKVFATDSKFESVSTALRGIGRDILSLNFRGAADQSRLLASAVQSITFKESLEGLKDLGTSLLNVGRSLLTNPVFLIGGAIAGIVLAYKEWSDAEEANKKVVIESNREKLKELRNVLTFQEDINKALGATDNQVTQQKIDNLEKIRKVNISEQKALKNLGDDANEDQKKRLEELKTESESLFNQLLILRAEQKTKERNILIAAQKKEREDAEKKKKQDLDLLNEVEAERIAAQKKSAEELKKLKEKNAENNKEIDNKDLLDTKTTEEQKTKDFEDELNKRFILNNTYLDKTKEEEAKKRKKDKAAQEEEDAKKEAIRQGEVELFAAAGNAIFEFQKSLDEKEIQSLDEKVKRGLLSQEQYDKQVAEIKRKAAVRDKEQAAFNIIISTAEAIIKGFATGGPALAAIAAALGAIELGIVLSKPIPKFADGVIDIQGGVRGKDSIGALLMPGESVMTTAETERHGDLLRSIRSNNLDEYLMDNYINPKLSAILGNSTAENLAKSAKLNGLDEYTLARVMSRNKGVNVQNADYLAKSIARELKSDSIKRTWS